MKNEDDDEASISLREINVPKKGDWCTISSVTISDITHPYYCSASAIRNKVENSLSNRSSVTDDEESSGSLSESRNFESLIGDESCMIGAGKAHPSAEIEPGFVAESHSDSGKWMPSWKKGMLDILQNNDTLNEEVNDQTSELISTKLNEAIDVGLKIVDREHKRLLRRQSARLSVRSDYNKELLTIDEVPEESQQSQDELFDRRVSRGLSLLEKERSILLFFKRDGSSFDGNAAEYFSWNNDRLETEVDLDLDRTDSREVMLLEKARMSLTRTDVECANGDSSFFSSNESCEKDGTCRKKKSMSIVDKHNALLSFCFDDSSNGADASVFSWNEEDISSDSIVAKVVSNINIK
ncbi:hypothetical protein HJC23_014044 [Cyclotella cryptica]|uniref:Uncharacterized protein n=1 Tax=Cyclotella cryptica TaxID=29204 RepID=A0ABD3QV50_9STRA|eukprot:CCRYP_002433-RA/>CCRYP_002433-RA protein AED:0.07 eAED:0.07 QI:0/-1/0/1/-1/1/1/0/352